MSTKLTTGLEVKISDEKWFDYLLFDLAEISSRMLGVDHDCYFTETEKNDICKELKRFKQINKETLKKYMKAKHTCEFIAGGEDPSVVIIQTKGDALSGHGAFHDWLCMQILLRASPKKYFITQLTEYDHISCNIHSEEQITYLEDGVFRYLGTDLFIERVFEGKSYDGVVCGTLHKNSNE